MSYAVVIHPAAPPDIHALLESYLHQHKGLWMVFSESVELDARFLQCELIKSDDSRTPWKVRLPIEYAMAIVDMRGKQRGIGFLADLSLSNK